MSEKTLIERLKEKTPEAFEEMILLYTRRLYSVGYRLLRNQQDAEDAVQETFLNAFQNIDRFQGKSSLYTWLYRIACNQCLMKLRQRDRHPIVPLESYLPRFEYGNHADKIMDWSQMPDLNLGIRELRDFFEKCIDELPEQFRLAYILKDVEKLSENEVCEILRITKLTMKNRVHRARVVIRQRIQDHFCGSTGEVIRPRRPKGR